MGYEIIDASDVSNPLEALNTADAVFVCGGNTHRLLHAVKHHGLFNALAQGKKPYIGQSAGAVLACPSIKTTNDWSIVENSSLDGLGLIPFQLNVHFPMSEDPSVGETREDRIADYFVNNKTPVLGLPNHAALSIQNGKIILLGQNPARIFLPYPEKSFGTLKRDIEPGQDVTAAFAAFQAEIG